MVPFLEIDDFAAEYGALSDQDRPQAERLLTLLSDRIIDRKPDVDETAAKQVVFEVTRDAVRFGDYALLKDFANTTSRRSESGTFADGAKPIDDYLTGRQLRMLDIAAAIRKPAYYFGD